MVDAAPRGIRQGPIGPLVSGLHKLALAARHDHSVAEVVGFDQSQRDLRVRWAEHRRVTPDHDGMDVEPVVVDPIVVGEIRGEIGAAQDEVSTGLRLESEHLGRHDVMDDR